MGSFKDRGVAVAAVKAAELGLTTLSCSSTGNVANPVEERAAADRVDAAVSCPVGLEAEKRIATAVCRVTIHTVEGSYDDVSCPTSSCRSSFPGPS